MKFFVLTLFVVAATAAPIEEEGGPVELIVNGVPEGQPIDLSDILDIKVKEHVDGQVVSATNLLHPYTAEGMAEAAAAESPIVPEPVILPAPATPVVIPQPAVLPQPAMPEVVAQPSFINNYGAEHAVPEPVILPSPAAPEVTLPEPVLVPQPVILPSLVAPEVIIPEPVVLPAPVAPEVVIPEPGLIPEPVILPSPVAPEVVVPEVASIPNGEIFNDGTVSVTLNTPQDAGVMSTIQSWFSLVLNYFNDGVQTTQQIV